MDFSGANLNEANLTRVNLTGANLTGAAVMDEQIRMTFGARGWLPQPEGS